VDTTASAEESRGGFALDSTRASGTSRGLDTFRRAWDTQLGSVFRLPAFAPGTSGDFRVRSRGTKVGDLLVFDFHGASVVRTASPPRGAEDWVRIYAVRRGAWILGGPDGHAEQRVSGGRYLLQHFGASPRFETLPRTSSRLLFLPAAIFGPMLGNRTLGGSMESAEMRMLLAHTNVVHATFADLGPAGVRAAHSTVAELARAVAAGGFDDVEPLLAPALAQAAKDLADRHLADPELSLAMLAGELDVSVRTLQRAFAATGEPVTAYIRRRRLEEVRLSLAALPPGRLSVSELAAHWQFADSSHFIRTFKKRYGQTPAEYARSTGSTIR
jgi:AraC-like DNA-binding protein